METPFLDVDLIAPCRISEYLTVGELIYWSFMAGLRRAVRLGSTDPALEWVDYLGPQPSWNFLLSPLTVCNVVSSYEGLVVPTCEIECFSGIGDQIWLDVRSSCQLPPMTEMGDSVIRSLFHWVEVQCLDPLNHGCSWYCSRSSNRRILILVMLSVLTVHIC